MEPMPPTEPRRLKRLRQKRFRRYLLSEKELQSHSHVLSLHPRMRQLYSRWRAGELTDVETVCEYILIFLRAYRSRDYLGGPHNEDLGLSDTASLPEAVRVFAQFSLRSVPLAVNRTIVGWALNRYPLHLLDFIPSAEELLECQARGERIVTCLFQPYELLHWVRPHGPDAGDGSARDPLGFTLHDLIHADHFFCDPEMRRGQVEFYREVRDRMKRGEYTAILADPKKRERFEYIIADMNSHPAHLRACLEHEVANAMPGPSAEVRL